MTGAFAEYFKLENFWEVVHRATPARIVIFGAARWGERLLEILETSDFRFEIVFVDNDSTKSGLELCGRKIISLESLDAASDTVLIGSISAGPEISSQLEGLGFIRDVSYFEVVRNLGDGYPIILDRYFQELCGSFLNLDVLHVGPGGNLGFELLLALSGARSVTSVEAYSYRLSFPEVTDSEEFYLALNKRLNNHLGKDLFDENLLCRDGDRLFINDTRIKLHFPCSVSDMPFANDSFDLVCHHAVFEHVLEPLEGYSEIYRVLRSGGRMVGMVDPQDHRAQASLAQFHPLKFLEMSRREWRAVNSAINPHNQLTTPEHKKMIEQCGFRIKTWREDVRMNLTPEIYRSFHPDFHNFDINDLDVLRFSVVAEA